MTLLPSAETTKAIMSRPKKSIDLDQSQSVPKASQFKSQPAVQSKPKSPTIFEATNSAGEVFTIGDGIQVTDPYRNLVTAAIESFYVDVSGDIWAVYKPVEVKEECRWEKGISRVSRLVRAEPKKQ